MNNSMIILYAGYYVMPKVFLYYLLQIETENCYKTEIYHEFPRTFDR